MLSYMTSCQDRITAGNRGLQIQLDQFPHLQDVDTILHHPFSQHTSPILRTLLAAVSFT